MKKIIDYCPVCGNKLSFEVPKFKGIPKQGEKMKIITCDKCGKVLYVKANIRVSYVIEE